MKHTVKLSLFESLVIEQDGESITAEIRVGGVPVIRKPVTVEQAAAAAVAFTLAAEDAAEASAIRTESTAGAGR